jgi:hypothetical protein
MKQWKLILMLFLVLVFWGDLRAQLPQRYTRYAQAVDTLISLQSSHPDICRYDTIGYSTRDSVPMICLKISDNAAIDEDEPAIFNCGGVHADEVVGVEVVMWFIYDILERYDSGDTVAARYINNLEIFCVPFINPEGHLVVEDGVMDWRKNKCDNDSNGVFNIHDGVDNNRNYDFGWSIDHEPDAIYPDSLQYKGTAPFTQTENIAMAAFAWKYRPIVALDYHSPTYGRSEVAYYPWWWWPSDGGNGASPDETMMYDICRNFCSRIIDDSGDSTYEARRALVNKGDFKTYFYGNFGTVTFSVEVTDTTIQDSTLVDGICERNLPGEYYLLQRALGSAVTGIIRDSVTMEPIEAEVQVTQHISPDINPRLSRPDFGRYHRILNPGTYTLRILKQGYTTKTISGVSVVSNQPTIRDVLLRPTNPRPPAPILIAPEPDTTLDNNLVTFQWHLTPYAQQYLLEVYLTPDTMQAIFIDSTIVDTSFIADSPFQDSLYFWRLRAGNSYGWGPFSEMRAFRINTASSIENEPQLPDHFALYQNFPNPFNMQTVIQVEINAGESGELAIFDLKGDLVRSFSISGREQPLQKIIWDGKNLNNSFVKSGVYFYRLKAGDKSLTRKMVLLK